MPNDTRPLSEAVLSAMSRQDICWMAGLLEGEGYFSFNANKIGVRLHMTDKDVVSRFARLWEVVVRELKTTAAHHKTSYLAHLPSKKAMQCMRMVRPLLGSRRATQVDAALTGFAEARASSRLLLRERMQSFTDDEIVAAWTTRPAKESMRAFCRRLGASGRKTVASRLRELGLLEVGVQQSSGDANPPDLLTTIQDESAWMAGLLEGEGCFSHIGGGVAVALQMTDEDVVGRFAALAGVRHYRAASRRQSHYLPVYVATAYGPRGAAVMRRVLPFMGERRAAKIAECLQQRAIGQARLQARRAEYEARLPAEPLVRRWKNRVAGETLSSFAREYGVHPEVMKRRLLELGVYDSLGKPGLLHFSHTCGHCGSAFVRPSKRSAQFCSRICSGRAQAQRRAAQRTASLEASRAA